jgi:2-iminobutanoate/2-iminopropanoate deaminase
MKKRTYPLFYSGQKQTFAKCVVVGDLVFCSGMSGRLVETGEVRNDDPYTQTVDALDKIKAVLEEAGSSLEGIVKMTVYFKDIGKDLDTIWFGAMMDYFRKHAPSLAEDMPAGTAVGIDSLAYPSMLVEIDVTAVIPG